MMKSIPKSLLLSAVALATTVVAPTRAQPPEEIPQLEIVERYALPLDGEVPFDVRWAGPDSVYVALEQSGVFEYDLGDELAVKRRIFPSAETLGFYRYPEFWNLAASEDWIFVSALGWHLAWREPPTGAATYNATVGDEKSVYLDLDVDHDRIVVLGLPHPDEIESKPGAIVWLGEINQDNITRWRPVYESEMVAERFAVIHDRSQFRGAVRFLDNGDFIVSLGFSPRLLLFSKTGKLEETWEPDDLWEDAESDGEWVEQAPDRDPTKRVQAQLGMLRNRHFIDEVLPHPDGPAIFLRRPGAADEERYRLGILGPEIRWYDVPPLGLPRASALRADVDGDGRIVVLGGSRSILKPARLEESSIIVLEIP